MRILVSLVLVAVSMSISAADVYSEFAPKFKAATSASDERDVLRTMSTDKVIEYIKECRSRNAPVAGTLLAWEQARESKARKDTNDREAVAQAERVERVAKQEDMDHSIGVGFVLFLIPCAVFVLMLHSGAGAGSIVLVVVGGSAVASAFLPDKYFGAVIAIGLVFIVACVILRLLMGAVKSTIGSVEELRR